MKKFLLFLTCVLTLFGVARAETVKITTTETKAASTSTSYVTTPTEVNAGGFIFVFDEFNPSTGQMRVNATALGGFNLRNKTAIPGLKSIKITADKTTLGTWYVKTSPSSPVTAAATTSDTKGTVSGSTVTFDIPSGSQYFMLNLTSSGSGTVKFTAIEVTYEASEPVAPNSLTFSPNGGEIDTNTDISIAVDAEATLPVTITYSIDNESYNQPYSTPFTLTAGQHTVYAKASNTAGEKLAQPVVFTVTQFEAPVIAGSATLNTTNFKASGTAYAKYTYEDKTYGFNYASVFALTNGNIQFNTNNSNGKASSIVVSGINDKYIIDHIDVTMGTPGNGIKVYSYDKAASEPTLGTEYKTPDGAKQVGTTITSTTKNIKIDDKAFIILPAGTGVIQISSVTVYYKEAQSGNPTLKTPDLTFNYNGENVTGKDVTVNWDITDFPTLTATVDGTVVSDLPISYTSNNESVASINANTGAVTLHNVVGEAKITATSAASETYNEASASYTLKVKDPNAVEKGTKEQPYTISEFLDPNFSDTKSNVWVQGYVVGYYNSSSKPVFSIDGAQSTNFVLGESSPGSENIAYIPVQLPSGNIRTAINLQDNPKNLGKQLKICGSKDTYFSTTGLKNPTEFEWIEDESDKRQEVILSFERPSYEFELNFTFESPKVTITPNIENADITYTSKDESVATVEASTGKLTLKAKGTTTITATFAGDDNYKNADASYSLTVTDSTPLEETVYKPVTKITEINSNSEYLIVAQTSTGEYYSLSTTTTSNRNQAVKVRANEEGEIVVSDENVLVLTPVIDPFSDSLYKYSWKTNSGSYLGVSGDNTNLSISVNGITDNSRSSIEIDNDGYLTVSFGGSPKRMILLSNTQLQFGNYASSNKTDTGYSQVKLYKKFTEEFYLVGDMTGKENDKPIETNPSFKFIKVEDDENEEVEVYYLEIASIKKGETFVIKSTGGTVFYNPDDYAINLEGPEPPLDEYGRREVFLQTEEVHQMSFDQNYINIVFKFIPAGNTLHISGTANNGDDWMVGFGNDKTNQTGKVIDKDGKDHLDIQSANGWGGAAVYVYAPNGTDNVYFKLFPETEPKSAPQRRANASELSGYTKANQDDDGAFIVPVGLNGQSTYSGTISLYPADSEGNLLSDDPKTYTYTITRTTTTGVDGIDADEEAEYFTLQGIKVQNPEKGIYIKVQNGKTSKVVL
ncbi:MAG: Ig-like domain-containing protein [Muribaculaceae bacterium]|nr:Ig-like domain-containing protein [Muribaculaceae bacterium]